MTVSAETYGIELCLQSCSYTSLPGLRMEQRDYIATLREELVQPINDDYEASLVSVWTHAGKGRLERLKWPSAGLKSGDFGTGFPIHVMERP